MSSDQNEINRLMTIYVKASLLYFEKDALQKVTKHLENNYNRYLPDCFEEPEYLKKTLVELYGETSPIINEIKQDLKNFDYHEKVKMFLQGLE